MRIKMKGQAPYCPLCFKPMQELLTPKGKFYYCLGEFCMVSISANDPCCGAWQRIPKERMPKCQFCHKPMRIFFRSDGYFKNQCRDKSHRFYQIVRGKVEDLPPEVKK